MQPGMSGVLTKNVSYEASVVTAQLIVNRLSQISSMCLRLNNLLHISLSD